MTTAKLDFIRIQNFSSEDMLYIQLSPAPHPASKLLCVRLNPILLQKVKTTGVVLNPEKVSEKKIWMQICTEGIQYEHRKKSDVHKIRKEIQNRYRMDTEGRRYRICIIWWPSEKIHHPSYQKPGVKPIAPRTSGK